jgi:hypothetical protein
VFTNWRLSGSSNDDIRHTILSPIPVVGWG